MACICPCWLRALPAKANWKGQFREISGHGKVFKVDLFGRTNTASISCLKVSYFEDGLLPGIWRFVVNPERSADGTFLSLYDLQLPLPAATSSENNMSRLGQEPFVTAGDSNEAIIPSQHKTACGTFFSEPISPRSGQQCTAMQPLMNDISVPRSEVNVVRQMGSCDWGKRNQLAICSSNTFSYIRQEIQMFHFTAILTLNNPRGLRRFSPFFVFVASTVSIVWGTY